MRGGVTRWAERAVLLVLLCLLGGCQGGFLRRPTPTHRAQPFDHETSKSTVLSAADNARIAEFKNRLQQNPNDLPAYRSLGSLLERQQQHFAAERLYRQALERQPDDAGFLAGLAQALAHRGEATEARRHALAALRQEQNLAKAHLVLAQLHEQAGQRQAAESAYREAWRCQPPAVEAGQVLARWAADRGQDAQAADYLRLCLLADPENPAARAAYGQVLARLEQPEEAIAQWETLLAQGQRLNQAHEQLAELYQKMGDPASARRHLVRVRPDGDADAARLAKLEAQLADTVARRPRPPRPNYLPLPTP